MPRVARGAVCVSKGEGATRQFLGRILQCPLLYRLSGPVRKGGMKMLPLQNLFFIWTTMARGVSSFVGASEARLGCSGNAPFVSVPKQPRVTFTGFELGWRQGSYPLLLPSWYHLSLFCALVPNRTTELCQTGASQPE